MLKISLGKNGETVATKFLLANGFTIVARNYKCSLGEIDIVAKAKEMLYFVEVKTRVSTAFGWPAEAVTPKKQIKLRKLALYYVARTHYFGPFVFGVVEVLFNQFTKHYQVNFIPNAF